MKNKAFLNSEAIKQNNLCEKEIHFQVLRVCKEYVKKVQTEFNVSDTYLHVNCSFIKNLLSF